MFVITMEAAPGDAFTAHIGPGGGATPVKANNGSMPGQDGGHGGGGGPQKGPIPPQNVCGTAGKDNPCTITTPFAPKMVIIQDDTGDHMVFVRSCPVSFCPKHASTNGKCTVTWSDTGVSWYNGNEDGNLVMYQFNDAGKTYYYTAIG